MSTARHQHHAARRPGKAGIVLIAIGLILGVLFLVLPLIIIAQNAFGSGFAAFWQNASSPDMVKALKLSLLSIAVALPINFIIGLSAAWLIAYHTFPGRDLLLAISKIPISLSPIVAGVCFIMLYGQRGWFGGWLQAHDIKLMFATPGILMATTFVSFPYLLNQLVPLMRELGQDEETVANQLGANGWQIFFRVTLPKIKWGVVYGLLLANARALGEFGAVSVVSGSIRGKTVTLPLQVEVLYNDYNSVGAFSAAAILVILALIVLTAKTLVEHISLRALRKHKS